MDKLAHKLHNRQLRAHRVRSQITGTVERPRLSVSISNLHITAQLIDDVKHVTLAYTTTVGQKAATGTMVEKATWIGTEIAKQAKAKKITLVVFDRGSKLYHGRRTATATTATKSQS